MTVEIRQATGAEAVGVVLLVVLLTVAVYLAGQVTAHGPHPQARGPPARTYLETVPQPMAGGGEAYVVRYLEGGQEHEIYCYSEIGRRRAMIYAGAGGEEQSQ